MSKTIAIIEDEPYITEALMFLLDREGFKTISHDDGAGAIDFLQANKPDMLILDVMLPNVSGMEILETIRAKSSLPELPVLMLTAKGQKKDRLAAQNAGASLFMTKPFSNDALVANVKSLVGA